MRALHRDRLRQACAQRVWGWLPTRALLVALASTLATPLPAAAQTAAVKVHVNGVDLHYIEQGRGQPVILLHGGQGDYRAWAPQMAALSTRYRVIAYSRRYNYPNDNPVTPSYRAAYSDAEDLAALIRSLKLGPVHLVGASAGAVAALVMATRHPELAASLVLAEPPVHHWAKDDPVGTPLYDAFMNDIWRPAGAAFRAGDTVAAMRILVDGFGVTGRFDGLAPDARSAVMANARFFQVATTSADPFPALDKAAVAELRMPVLIVTGANTIPLHRFVNDELARQLPRAQRVTIPNAGHGSARENPSAFTAAVAAFLAAPHAR